MSNSRVSSTTRETVPTTRKRTSSGSRLRTFVNTSRTNTPTQRRENTTRRTEQQRRDRLANRERSKELQRQRFRPMMVIIGAVMVLLFIGLVEVLSASSVFATSRNEPVLFYFQRQFGWVAIGLVAMSFCARTDYRFWRPFVPLGTAVTVGLLLLTLTPLALVRNGSARWINLGFASFQPAELAKIVMVVFTAKIIAERQHEMSNSVRTILPVGILISIFGAICLLQPDLGTPTIVVVVCFIMLVVGGARLDVMAAFGGLATAAFLLFAFAGYRGARWNIFTPVTEITPANFQRTAAVTSVSSGGWFGSGPGGSKLKWGYLPEAHTDSIFAVIGEELGLLGALFVISLYVAIFFAGLKIAQRAADRFGKMLALGITTMITVQAFINIGVAVAILPTKGFTLPFVSYGGTSVLFTLAATGILLSVARAR